MEKVAPIFLIFGPIGSGKGTQAKLLADKLGLINVSLGDVLREQANLDTPEAIIIKDHMSRGELVPYEIVDDLVRKRLEQPDMEKGVIFDGYPRVLEQAKTLITMLDKHNRKITKVISLQLEPEEILNRLSTRLVCPNCRSIYNVKSAPPKVAGICDKCGGPLKQRADDQEVKAIHERMEVYAQDTVPVLKFFGDMGLVHDFDAAQSIEEIHREIAASL